MPPVVVSETRLPRDFGRYAREFALLELSCEPGDVPGRGRLEACARQAPDGFAFSLVLPSAIAALEPGSESEAAWKLARGVERLIQPAWWVVRTPPAVRPTARSRAKLGELFEQLREQGARVAWEPGGLWEPASAVGVASELGAVLVQDVACAAPVAADALYARLLALGRGSRIGLEQAERVAQRALQFEQAVVVVEGRGAREVQRAVRRAERERDAWEETPDDSETEAEAEAEAT